MKYDRVQVGPIGTPSSEMTSVGSPSMTIWSVRWFSSGPVPAISLA